MQLPFKTKNLLEIYEHISSLVTQTNNYELTSALVQIRQTYSTMLQYMVKGIDDPNSGKIYADMVRQCYVIGYRASRLTRLKDHMDEKYATTFRSIGVQSFSNTIKSLEESRSRLSETQSLINDIGSVNELDLKLESQRKVHQELLISLFNIVWTSDIWESSDYQSASSLLSSSLLTSYDKSLFVGAVVLSVIEMFDERKFMILCDAYVNDSDDVSMRGIVGIVLSLRKYDSSINIFPNISARLSLLFDSESFVKDIYLVMMQLQYSKITDRVSDKVRNDILPSLLSSGKFKKTKYGITEIDDYMTKNGENPEWHKGDKDPAVMKKMEEMAQLQMDGADVQMSSFIHMKKGPFFYPTANWFMPFSVNHPEISSILDRMRKNQGTANALINILKYAPFCSSDRYSFTFMLDNIGISGQNMITQSLSGEMSEEDMQTQLDELKKRKTKKSEHSRYFIQDLYRFFIAYPYHNQFYNPFDKSLPSFTPLDSGIFELLLDSKEELLSLAEFYMRKELYSDALRLYNALEPQESEDQVFLWQQIGFCQQQSGDMESALSSYSIAYSLNPNSKWTLRHLARIAYHQKQYSDAEVYYDLLLSDEEDNLKYLKRKADCQIQDGRYEDAIPLLYKISYLDENSSDVKDELAHSLLMTGKYEKSKDIYNSLSATYPDNTQYLVNLANIYYVEKDFETAFTYYCEAYNHLKTEENGEKRFKRMFVDAAKSLKPLGIDINKFQMMYDAVSMGIM